MRKVVLTFLFVMAGSIGWSSCRNGNIPINHGGIDWCCTETSSDSWSCTDGAGCWICVGDCVGGPGGDCYNDPPAM